MLTRALHEHGLHHKLQRRFPLEVWTAAVGHELARRARPTALTAGVLHILVRDCRWRDQLDAARVFLIARLNEKLGRPAVRELRFGLAHAGFLEEASAADPVGSARAFALALPPRCPRASSELVGNWGLPAELHQALCSAAGAAISRRALW